MPLENTFSVPVMVLMVFVERVTREADCYCTDHLGNVVRPDSLVYHGHAVLASVVFSYHLLAECTLLAQKITNYTDSNVQDMHAHAQCNIIQRDAIHLSFFFCFFVFIQKSKIQYYNHTIYMHNHNMRRQYGTGKELDRFIA